VGVAVGVAVALGVGVAEGVAVGVAVGVGVGVAEGVAEGVGVGSDAVLMQVDALMVSLMRVTSPVEANTRPATVTPEPRVIEVDAMTVPAKVGPSRTAVLPTCQNTLHAEAPSVSETLLLVPVVRLDPVWKMNTALASPCPFKMSVPLRLSAPSELVWYTPGSRVRPVRSAGSEVLVGLSPAACLYAVVRSFWAPSAVLSAAKVV
jgi:hypothetical protein